MGQGAGRQARCAVGIAAGRNETAMASWHALFDDERLLVSELAIWMNDELVGSWLRTRGSDAMVYEPSWIESPRGRPLSLSLPFSPGGRIAGAVVANFFDNLLPDSRAIRERMGRRFRVKSDSAFELLSAIGRDCVGAVQLLPSGPVPERVRE